MAFIHCCSALHKCRSFILEPTEGYIFSKVLILENCPTCGCFKLQLLRVNFKCEVCGHTLKNKKARKLLAKMQSNIIFEEKEGIKINAPSSNFYLRYSDRGKIKKCYSNISGLKIGMFDERFPSNDKEIITKSSSD